MMKKLLLTGLALSLPLGLAACGFTPMHDAPKVGDTTAFKNLQVELVEPEKVAQKEAGYFIEQHMRDRFGDNIGSHTVKISPRTSRRQYGINTNDVASRYDMIISADYELVDNVTGEVLTNGKVSATTTFGTSRDPYARISSEKTAMEQVARDTSDRILLRLAAYYNNTDRADKVRDELEREREERRRARAEEMGIEYIPRDQDADDQ